MNPGALEPVSCPACGGAGGGPIGRAGSAWDDEEFVCPRCLGVGYLGLEEARVQPASQRPGIAKVAPEEAGAGKTEKRKASA